MNAKDVPVNVKTSLEKTYAVIDADWDKEGATDISVVLNGIGLFLETEREIKKSELPSAILYVLKRTMQILNSKRLHVLKPKE